MTKMVQGVCQNVYEEFCKQKCSLTQAIFTALLERQKDNKSSPILADDEQTSIPDEKPEEPAEPRPSKSVNQDVKEEVTLKPDADTPEMLEIIPSNEPDVEKQEAISRKVEDETKETEETKSEVENAVVKKEEQSEEIDIEDPDDYLMYLEEILSKIHSEYYKQYDKTGIVPVMRDVIPNIRRKILEGQSIVFSGVVPTHVSVNNSRYAQMARKLGATVAEQVGFL
jgi:RNA polymerase II subunit A C-terminal domain phosphatase